jgi:hypothetical protein
MSEQITWSLVKNLKVDDVVRLNYGGTSHYFAVDVAPEPTGKALANAFRDGMPEVEIWQTEMDSEMNVIADSEIHVVNGNCRVQVLV